MINELNQQEAMVECRVTYTLELGGRFYIVENVPARVNPDTGEQFFAPQTVERLQRIIRNNEPPVRILETPVFEYAG